MGFIRLIIILFVSASFVACGDQVEFQKQASSSFKSSIDPSELPPEPPGGVQPPNQQPPHLEPPSNPPVTPPPSDNPEDPVVIIPEPQLRDAELVFQQSPLIANNKVDILVIEDTSLSMHSDRWTLHQKFDNMFTNLQGLDWRVGVTTTDLGRFRQDGSLVDFDYKGTKYLTPRTSNFKQKFLDVIGFDVCNESDTISWTGKPCTLNSTRVLEATVVAASKNNNFFRKDASLAVVYITDEDEEVPNRDHLTTPSEVKSAIEIHLGADKSYSFHGAYIQPGDSSCLDKQKGHFTEPNSAYAHSIDSLVAETQGNSTSICGSDFSSLFSNLSGKVGVEGELDLEFDLPHNDPLGIEVTIVPAQDIEYSLIKKSKTVNGVEIPFKAIRFTTAPSAGSQITVKYKYEE